MKNKKIHKNHQHVTIHQRLERLAHHHILLTGVLAFMVLGFVKYQAQLSNVIHSAVDPESALATTYAHTHHYETLRLPIEYGTSIRHTPISGE